MSEKPFIGCNESPYNGKVYFIDEQRRRWVRDAAIINKLGYKWPDDVGWVGAKQLEKIPLGAEVPSGIGVTHKNFKKVTMQDMREIIVSSISGRGVEFGAAANPLPVPLGTIVKYADIASKDLLENELYQRDLTYEYVGTDIISSFDDMEHIGDNSLDFIIASHVIEHVRDPIKTLNLSWQKLRSKGKLALIIPKYERTLDHRRSLTKLDHLIEDHYHGSKYRDLLHIAEFYTYAKQISHEELYHKMVESITDEHHSMHYHVWNEKSFAELIKYVYHNHHPWRTVFKQPALPGKENYEFYIVLQKP